MKGLILRPFDGPGGSRSFDLVDRETGELLDPTDPDVQALALEACRVEENRLREFKRAVTSALVTRTQEYVERTHTLPSGRKIVREGGPETVYDDPAGLKRELLEAGVPPERVSMIVVETIDRKVSGVEAAKAARSNEKVAAIIARYARKIDRPFSIKLG